MILILNIARYQWTDAPAFPSVSSIAVSMGRSVRSIRRRLAELDPDYLVRQTRRNQAGFQQTSAFDLSPLEKMLGVRVNETGRYTGGDSSDTPKDSAEQASHDQNTKKNGGDRNVRPEDQGVAILSTGGDSSDTQGVTILSPEALEVESHEFESPETTPVVEELPEISDLLKHKGLTQEEIDEVLGKGEGVCWSAYGYVNAQDEKGKILTSWRALFLAAVRGEWDTSLTRTTSNGAQIYGGVPLSERLNGKPAPGYQPGGQPRDR